MLIVGFVVLGALVYQVSAPAREPGNSSWSFGEIIDDIRREIRGNPGRAEVTSKHTHAVPAGINELRVTPRGSPITIVGENRTDIESELWVRSNGADDAEAKKLAEATKLVVEAAGPTLAVGFDFPEPGSQNARLHLRVPQNMVVQLEPSVGKVEVSGVAGVELENARGETIVKNITGRANVMHRGGDLTVEDVQSLRLNARGSEARLAKIRSECVLQLVAGSVKATNLAGPIEIDATNTDLTLEDLQATKAPLKINAVEGTIMLRGLSSEARIDGRESEIDVALAAPAAVAIFNTGERVHVTPPEKGYTLDVVAINANVILPPGVASAVPLSKDEARHEVRGKGDINGGGPTITIRSTRGEIRINPRP
jgi:Putative adhesin